MVVDPKNEQERHLDAEGVDPSPVAFADSLPNTDPSMVSGRTIVVGAGPAGLTAALELAKLGRAAVVYEADDIVGGISRSVPFRGCRLDIGGHRFFTKVKEVEDLWYEILGEDLLERQRLS